MEIVDVSEKKEIKVEEFYCPECRKRVDLCRCERYKDGGCWDCDSSCVVNNRRKAIKALKEAVEEGRTFPEKFLGVDHLFKDTKIRSLCCGFPLKKFAVKVVISPRLIDENVLYICPLCGIAYRQP